VGASDRVLQAAVDYVARLGGGTVHILPGTYTLRNAVFLPSKIRLLGSGPDSILTKIGSETVPLADDSNWFDQEITSRSRRGFEWGTESCCERRTRITGVRTSSSARWWHGQGTDSN
jgi:hypothetical protein